MGMDTDMDMDIMGIANLIRKYGKKTEFWNTGLLNGAIDIHSHYLPGVDDGMKSMEEAIGAITKMAEHGVKRIYLTPHVMEDYPENTTTYLREQFNKFREKVPDGIELSLAAEYMLDTSFYKHLEGELLTLKNKHTLIEMSYFSPSPELNNAIYRLQLKGYTPILAHPERYRYMSKESLRHTKELGCKYQLNLMSLSGLYGKRVSEIAWSMLKEGEYDFLGTDIHNYSVFHRNVSHLRLADNETILIKNLIEKNKELQ